MSKTVADVRQRALEAIASGRLSQAAIAKSIGKSASTVSMWLRGQYGGDAEAIAAQIADMLGLEAERDVQRAELPQGFQETSVARRVMSLLQRCRVACDFGLVVGDVGLGKTMAIEEYQRRHPSVIVLRARAAARNLVPWSRALAQAVGVTAPGEPSRALDEIIKALSNTGRMLVIDEAQRLGDPALETLRDIHDEAGVGVVLSGNQGIHTMVAGSPQRRSRVGAQLDLRPEDIQDADVELLCGPLPVDVQHALHGIAQTRGGLRAAMKTLGLALELRRHREDMALLEAVRTAFGMRGLGTL